MDLKAKNKAREARLKAKRDAIKAQNEQIDPTEADTVAEAKPAESISEDKK